jgi:hypothetical protein
MVPFYESNGTTIMRYREQLALHGGGLALGFTSLIRGKINHRHRSSP